MADLTHLVEQEIEARMAAQSSATFKADLSYNPTTSLSIKGVSKKTAKKVGVRIRPSDSLGAAAMPHGYTQAQQSHQSVQAVQIPISHQERIRMNEESRPYSAPVDKIKVGGKKVIRVGGGEIWEDSSLVHWDNGIESI